MTASPTNDNASLEHKIGDLSKELSQARGELAEAREQQDATAGILAAISSSPADLRRVCAEIAASAALLCGAYDAQIFHLDGEFLQPIAHHGQIPQSGELPLTRGFVTGRAVIDHRTIHVDDMQAEIDEYPQSRDLARRLGIRTVLAHPLMGGGVAIGAIVIRRTELRPFSEKQVDLLKTFADQAVIAIENARLFEAEQARTKELTQSLDYQMAISDVLSVISRSPNQLQPVLDTIVAIARRLCKAEHDAAYRLRDGKYVLAAPSDAHPSLKLYVAEHPFAPGRESLVGRTALEGKTIHLPDCLADPEFAFHDLQRMLKFRTMLGVPLLRNGMPIGVISLVRNAVQPFADREIGLVTTFADQAVIAIENTRLFEEVQTRTRELTESLEQQTATSEILSVKI